MVWTLQDPGMRNWLTNILDVGSSRRDNELIWCHVTFVIEVHANAKSVSLGKQLATIVAEMLTLTLTTAVSSPATSVDGI